jgi:hypothetical protein
MTINLPDELLSHSVRRYWGIAPESILLYNNAAITGSDEAWADLRRYYDLTIYVTNHAVDWQTYTTALESIVEQWFPPTTKRLAQHATAMTADQFVLGAAYESEGGVLRLLRTAQEYDEDAQVETPVILPRRDAQSIATQQDINLLRSFGVLRATMDGLQFNKELLRTLHGSRELTVPEACWAILARLYEAHGFSDVDSVIPQLLESFGITSPENTPTNIWGSFPVYIADDRVSEFVDELFAKESREVFTDLAYTYNSRAERLCQTTGLSQGKEPTEDIDWPITDRAAAVCAVASQHARPVAIEWLVNAEPDSDKFRLHRRLADAGFNVSLQEELLEFKQPYAGPTDPDSVSEYENYVKTEQTRANKIATTARHLSGIIDGAWVDQRKDLLSTSVSRVDEITTAPIEFIFSMFDPTYHADKYEIEEYVGESPHLADEVKEINKWRTNQPHDAVTFTDKVREICAQPLEEESIPPRLRVMSPWLNFTIKEYTALFQRLLANDIHIQLLIRLPDPKDWSKLKQNFLTRIGDTHGNLEIRTYTRYKKFKDHTQLRKHKRGELDDDGDASVSETGIHAKLFITGDADNGAVLAGSANLMENSFYYNPEAGIHTRHPEVIQTAIDYFDLIWEVAEPDAIDESVFTGKTNFQFYPKVYRP